tara:strand:- start:64 stop:1674 length:1611 start_codon:yes stop_codon:yes gene_type:complete
MKSLNFVKFYPILTSLIFILYSWSYNNEILYPIDDAYIYLQQAKLLSEGFFLQYSEYDTKTNACTSFIYYIIYSFFWKIVQIFDLELKKQVEWITIINFIFNFFLLIIFINLIKKISLEYLKKNQNIIFFILLSTIPISYSFFSGLETGLTVTLVTIQFYSIFKKQRINFLLSSVVLSLNRPENIILNLFLIIFYIVDLFLQKKIKKEDVYIVILIFLSILIIPIINYINYSDIKVSGYSRVNWGLGKIFWFKALLFSIPTSIYKLLTSIYATPDYFDYKYYKYFNFIQLLVFLIFIISLITLINNSKKKLKKLIFLKKKTNFNIIISKITFYFKNYRFGILATIFIIGYSCLPLTLASYGELSRYVAPILPLLILVLFKELKFKKNILLLFLFLNLSYFPLYLNTHIKSTETINNLHVKIAGIVNSETNKNDVTATLAAGYLSLFVNGKIIDPYGLGTFRYAKIKHNIDLVYEQIKKENFTYILTFDNQGRTPSYMSLFHFKKVLNNKKLNTLVSGDNKNPDGKSSSIFSFIKVE